MQRLHRVDHTDVRPRLLERCAHHIELGLREDLDRFGAAEAGRAKGDLRDGFLARDQQSAPTAARDRAERAEEERRLADPRLTSDEDERSGNETTSQHSIELGDPGRDALGLVNGDLPEGNRRESPCRRGRVRAVELLDQVPNAAQPGQRPSQRPLVVPHSVHVN